MNVRNFHFTMKNQLYFQLRGQILRKKKKQVDNSENTVLLRLIGSLFSSWTRLFSSHCHLMNFAWILTKKNLRHTLSNVFVSDKIKCHTQALLRHWSIDVTHWLFPPESQKLARVSRATHLLAPSFSIVLHTFAFCST